MEFYSPTTSSGHKMAMPQFRGILTILALLAALVAGAPAHAQTGPAIGTDMVLGKADAPVTVIEYASLTCPHCAHFHEAVWPQLKSQYIDTGKVRFIYRDFPLDEAAARAAQLARCNGTPESFFGFLDILFPQQQVWATQQFKQNLQVIARMGGIGEEQFLACMNNQPLLDSIVKARLDGVEKFKVSGTPTLIVNDRNIGSPTAFEAVRDAIEAALPGSARTAAPVAQGGSSPAASGAAPAQPGWWARIKSWFGF